MPSFYCRMERKKNAFYTCFYLQKKGNHGKGREFSYHAVRPEAMDFLIKFLLLMFYIYVAFVFIACLSLIFSNNKGKDEIWQCHGEQNVQ